MTTHARATATTDTPAVAAPTLQRACACGETAGISGKCPSCAADERLGVQPKLSLGRPGDRWEQEADRIANQVVADRPVPLSGPLAVTPLVQRQAEEDDKEELQAKRERLQRQPEEEDEEELQAKPEGLQRQAEEEEEELQAKSAGGTPTGPAIGRAAAAVSGGGRPLSRAERSWFEPRLGRDLSPVRVHHDASAGAAARDIHARAYTLRNHIAFAPGAYDGTSTEGRRLMAHELVHTAQQGAAKVARRVGAPGVACAPVAIQRTPENGDDVIEAPPGPPGKLESTTPRVDRIKIACDQGKIVFETAGGFFIYNMHEAGSCTLEGEEFPARIEITKSRINFYPAPAKHRELAERNESIDFGFRLRKGQDNPKTLLEGQSTVLMAFVSSVPAEGQVRPPEPETALSCLHRFPNKRLIDKREKPGTLFEKKDGTHKVFSQKIPLGQFGWVDASATASYSLEGAYLAKYGPGDLKDVCLVAEAAPPGALGGLLGLPPEYEMSAEMAKRLAEGKAIFGGQARFMMPASVVVQIKAEGGLRAGLDYLSIVELAAAEGRLKALGSAQLDGRIEAEAKVVWDQEADTFEISTDARLAGAAQLSFKLGAELGATLAGVEIWKQVWNLADTKLGVGWVGGVKYAPKDGLEINKGEVRRLDTETEIFSAQAAGDDKFLAETVLDHDQAMDDIFDEKNKDAFKNENPEGWTEDDAIPFDWRKPEADIYPDIVPIPGADDPKELDRSQPPRFVHYTASGRPKTVMIGVAEWPKLNDVFELRKEPRAQKQADAFKRMFRDNFTYPLSANGLDVEHVWDVGLRGAKFDRFDNLWPSYDLEQQLAGKRHERQIAKAEDVAGGSLENRFFKIVNFRHPAEDP